MSEEKVLTLRGKKAVWKPASSGVGGGVTSLYINTVPGTPICNLEQSKLVELFVDLTAAETAMDEMAMMDAFAAFPACLLMATVSNAPTMYYPDKKEYAYNPAGSTIIYVFSEAEKRVSLNADGTFTVS